MKLNRLDNVENPDRICARPFIMCSAVYYKDGAQVHKPRNITAGIVVAGIGHHVCFETLAALYPDRCYIGRTTEGFLTSDNRFVGREEALVIAAAAGQIRSNAEPGKHLYSEDIFYK